MEYVSVAEAARHLGITEHAVRQRAQRGTLPSRREAGKVLIGLENEQVTHELPGEQFELPDEQLGDDGEVHFLREQNARLTGMIESMQRDHAREIQELHVLLQNTQRLIPATVPDAPHTPERSGDEESRRTSVETPYSAPQQAEQAAEKPQRWPWWMRLLGGR